jgi:hypothetical protein
MVLAVAGGNAVYTAIFSFPDLKELDVLRIAARPCGRQPYVFCNGELWRADETGFKRVCEGVAAPRERTSFTTSHVDSNYCVFDTSSLTTFQAWIVSRRGSTWDRKAILYGLRFHVNCRNDGAQMMGASGLMVALARGKTCLVFNFLDTCNCVWYESNTNVICFCETCGSSVGSSLLANSTRGRDLCRGCRCKGEHQCQGVPQEFEEEVSNSKFQTEGLVRFQTCLDGVFIYVVKHDAFECVGHEKVYNK